MLSLLPLALTFAGDPFAARVAPFLAEHCVECHGGAKPEADLVLESFRDEAAALADRPLWAAVRERLLAGEMPPPEKSRPPQSEVDAVLAWIDGAVGPRVVLRTGGASVRRMNRAEYEASVRDLLGVEYRAAQEFPADDVGYGFDRIADVLSTPDILSEKLLLAAERIAARAVVVEDPAHTPVQRRLPVELIGSAYSGVRGGPLWLFSNADASGVFRFPRDGDYLLRARAFGKQAGADPCRMALTLDQREAARFAVSAVEGAGEVYEARARIGAGSRRVAAAFLNDYWKPDEPDPAQRDRNLAIEWLEVVGPVDAPALSEFQCLEMGPGSTATARMVVERLAGRAWRRPASREDVDRLMALSPESASREARVRLALQAILVSPRFLFLFDADPTRGIEPAGRVDGFALAARLASWLWSSLPDTELRLLAARGALRRPAVLDGQVARLIADPRSTAFVEQFAGQWLTLRGLDRAAPNPAQFPGFDEDLRAAMRAETELVFEAVLREDMPVSELLSADWTFLNERLAEHYGVPGVRGDKMRRVRLGPGPRGGLLFQGSVLTVTSNPTRTSPAKRGKWILENLLGAPPPPPPPGVGVLDESHAAVSAASLRARLEQHRTDPACSACHAALDGLGLALENFDPIGRWRENDAGFPIDAAGSIAGRGTFAGPVELKRILASEVAFVRTLARKLAIYAFGRGLTAQDEAEIDALLASFESRPPTLRDLIAGIVRSAPFSRSGGGRS